MNMNSRDRQDRQKKMKEIASAFKEFDRDRNGFISLQEAHAVLENKLGYTAEKTRKLMRICDRNGDGQLSYDEFIDFFTKVQTSAAELRALFHEFDRDQRGKISITDAKDAFRNLAFNENEIEHLVHAYDANHDGYLQYDEFCKFWNAN